MSGTFLVVTSGDWVLLASRGWKIGTLLIILLCMRQRPQQRMIRPKCQQCRGGEILCEGHQTCRGPVAGLPLTGWVLDNLLRQTV